jgi:3,5-epimerase/4-reductase
MVATTEKGVVFGNGFLGNRIGKHLGYEVMGQEVIDVKGISAVLDTIKPTVVVNAVGITGRPNIDWCEDHKPDTLLGNVAAPIVLASLCVQRGIHFVHLGSGCIYQGENGGIGYSEQDPPNHFEAFYPRTKIMAEGALKELPVLQIRIRMPIDDHSDPRNLIDKIKGYPRVVDQTNSMTIIPEMLEALRRLIAKRSTGVYNLVNPGVISPYEIMLLYKEIVDPSASFVRINAQELDHMVVAKRSNCRLDTRKLATEGIVLSDIHDGVRACLLNYRRSLT